MNDNVDYYGHRLAEVNNTNPVVANEDIRNADGVLLVSKGSNFSPAKAELIVKHKLIKPLEHSVDVAKSLDAKGLYDLMCKFAATIPGLKLLVDDEKVQEALMRLCKRYAKFPLIRQKLTVLANQLPEIYYHSLFCALGGTAIALQLAQDEKEQEVIFIGSLMHNTGFLHLDPKLTQCQSQLEDDESLDTQVHPIIAKKFLDHVPKLSKDIGKAVANHHERTDGTGYPKHKFGVELSLASQVIAICDTVATSYKRFDAYQEHAYSLILLTLQLNDNVHFETVYKAAAVLCQKIPVPAMAPATIPCPGDSLKQLEHITYTFEQAKKIAFVLMKAARSKLTRSIASMVGRLASSIVSSGIMQTEHREWLEELKQVDSPSEHINLLRNKVMQDEIEEQLERLKMILWKTIKALPEEEHTLRQTTEASYMQLASSKR